jgi:hypothetical protein
MHGGFSSIVVILQTMNRQPTESDIPPNGFAPYHEFHLERIRAHVKHAANGNSRENASWKNQEWLAILMEELGEVAHELTYDSGENYKKRLRAELVQVGAMTAAWIDAIDNT